jgi:hypothetical protein
MAFRMRRFISIGLLPASLLGGITWMVWFQWHDLLRSYDYVNILGDHFHLLRDRLLQGDIPWWNPYVALGRPFFTDIHFGTHYPPTYLLLFGERVGCFLLHWFHLALLYTGLRRVAEELEIQPSIAVTVALFAGLAGCFAPRVMLGQLLFAGALCWLPWVLWFVLRLGPEWSWPNVSGLTLALTLSFLAGNTNVWWVLCVGAGVTFIFRELFEGRTDLVPRIRGRSLQFAVALALTVGLTAPAWLPYLDLVGQANRLSPSYEFANAFTARPADLLSLFAIPTPAASFNWERCFFVGALWLTAAVAGLFTTRDARLRALAATTVFALLYSLGEHTPVHRLCYHLLPGTAGFRVPSRMAPWAAVGLLLLGASYLSRPAGGRRVLFSTGIVLAVAIAGMTLARRISEDPVDTFGWTTFIQLILAAVMVTGAHRWTGRRYLLPAVAAAIALIEACLFLSQTRTVYSYEAVMGSPPDFPFVDELARLPAALDIAAHQPPPRANLPDEVIPPNAGIRHRVAMVNGDTPLFLARPWRYLHAVSGVKPSDVYRNLLPSSITTRPAGTMPLISLNLARTPNGNGFTATADSFPRAYLTSSIRTVLDQDAVLEALAAGFPFARSVLAEGSPESDFGALNEPIKPVTIKRFEDSRLLVDVTNEAPACLVFSEAWFPGWIARDGGMIIEAEPMNGWMRGFRLPPGTHHLEILFRPRNYANSWGIAAITASLWAIASTRRPRHSSSSPA